MLSFGSRTGHSPPARGHQSGLVAFISGLITILPVLIVFGAVYYFINSTSSSEQPSVQRGTEVAKNGEPASVPLRTSEPSADKQAVAFARLKQQQAADLGEELLGYIDACLDESRRFETYASALLTNDEGKKIAADTSLVKRVRLIQSRERPNPGKAAGYRPTVALFVANVRAALESPSDLTIPSSSMSSELERMRVDLKGQREIWRADRVLLEAIAIEARRGPSGPSPKTLQEAMKANEEAEALAFTETLERETTRVRDEMNKKAIAAKTEGIRTVEQANIDKQLAEKRTEAERIRTEAFLKEAKEKKEAEAAKAKVEKDRLIAKALDPKTKQKLAPFLAKTNVQPTLVRGKVENAPTATNSDYMSFTRLKTVGALEPTKDGLEALAIVGAFYQREPRWQIDTNPATWTKDTTAMVEEVQALLRELGPTLVEEKLLGK